MSRTSTDVKRKYNEKTYSRLFIALPKELVIAYKAKCNELKIPYTQIIKETIEKFVSNQ